MTQIEQKIINHFQHLTSFQLAELLDFTEFLLYRKKTDSFNPDAIDKICGKYKDSMRSSDVFARKKQEEIQIEEDKWKRK